MRINFLGTSNANPKLGYGHSGILLSIEDKHYLFDCGDAVPTKIWLDQSINICDISSVFLTHLDPDHMGGIFSFFQLMHQATHEKKKKNEIIDLEVFIPSDCAKQPVSISLLFHMLLPFLRMDNKNTNYQKNIKSFFGSSIIYSDKNMMVSSFLTHHKPEAHGFIIYSEGKKVVYTGDIKSPEIIAPHINDVDLLIIEASKTPLKNILNAFKDKNIDVMILTHLKDERVKDQLQVIKEMTNEQYPVIIAHDGLIFDL